ncbi:hypothetical protein TMSFP069_19250 [Staphylococcus argenteus]|nr:hypothetical protein TMSFP069_19250 [Staphylococcus argenteus]GJF63349.1 hypothetical protein SA19109_23360 [Staphylococcus argenteus]GJF68611.1 hypothetical protein SA19136_23590 [Staphylococcus argenteus]GJF84035.1 hypothetical protein SA20004_22870 [Staphylococcus argenteus]
MQSDNVLILCDVVMLRSDNVLILCDVVMLRSDDAAIPLKRFDFMARFAEQ